MIEVVFYPPQVGLPLSALSPEDRMNLPAGTRIVHPSLSLWGYVKVKDGTWASEEESGEGLPIVALSTECLIQALPGLEGKAEQGMALSSVAPEPAPSPGTGDMWAEILAVLPPILERLRPHLVARREMGIQKYGVPLQRDNGRDAKMDEAQEHLDAAVYRWTWAGENGQTWDSLNLAGTLLGVFDEVPEAPALRSVAAVPVDERGVLCSELARLAAQLAAVKVERDEARESARTIRAATLREHALDQMKQAQSMIDAALPFLRAR